MGYLLFEQEDTYGKHKNCAHHIPEEVYHTNALIVYRYGEKWNYAKSKNGACSEHIG
jgi:hypothetical protein